MRLIFIGLLTISSILASSRCGFSDHLKYDDHEERISPPQLDMYAMSPTGHFYVHYDTTGNDAPNLSDLDNNYIPDYVDEVGIMADSIRYVLVDVMGYLPEPEDEDGIYDIYLEDRGYLNYGINTPIDGSGASYLIIDDEFEEGDYYIPGINTMRLTLAHEFFHAIQRGYKAYPSFYDIFFYELTSTWIEDVVVPDGDDYLNWIDDFFDDPDQNWDDTDGYSLALFGHFLTRMYDTPNQLESTLMRKIWERIDLNDTPIEAVNHVLSNEYSTTFIESWLDFVSMNLFNQIDASFYYYEDQGLINPISTNPTSTIEDFTINLNNESVAIKSFLIDETSAFDLVHSNSNFIGSINNIGQNNIIEVNDGYTNLFDTNDKIHFVYATEDSSNTLSVSLDMYVYGCTDTIACNYNPDASVYDNSCMYFDCSGECGGSAILDDCGVCDGDNSTCYDAFGLDNTLDILTWDIESFPKSNTTTVTTVAEIINQLDVDIIALQDIQSNGYFTNLINELEGWEGFKANSAPYNIDLAFIYNSDEIVSLNEYEIFESDWNAFPRSPLVFNFIWNGYEIVIINNHLKALDGYENENRRRDACEKLENYVSSNLANENVIVLGDLNDSLTDPYSSNVFLSFINDSQNYQFTDENIATGSSSYWSYPTWPSHIDHVLITNELFDEFNRPFSLCQTILAEEYLQGGWQEYDSVVSDHRPVGIRLQFDENETEIADHLLLSRIVVTPDEAESISIINPTDEVINLSDYYICDDKDYFEMQTDGDLSPSHFINGFTAQFPDIDIQPNETLLLVLNEDYTTFYTDSTPNLFLFEGNENSMLETEDGSFGNSASAKLDDDSESIILFKWDGNPESNIQDVDYFIWGGIQNAIDKTGEGSFFNDTPIEEQLYFEENHDDYYAFSRISSLEEIDELVTNGNGITGHDETSENFRESWEIISIVEVGCMDIEAENYNPDAVFDDGSCEYWLTLSDVIHNCDEELGDELITCNGSYDLSTESALGCPLYDETVTTIGIVVDYFDITPFGGPHSFTILGDEGNQITVFVWPESSEYQDGFDITQTDLNVLTQAPYGTYEVVVTGVLGAYCNDDEMLNIYNEWLLTVEYEEDIEIIETHDIYGCTDPYYLNYNEFANIDDGSCEVELYYSAQIVSVEDIPFDQGGYVYINFLRSFFDTDTLLRNVEFYSIERLDSDSVWVNVQSGSAYNSDYYTFEVHTLEDSSSFTDGITQFRVIASMEEGNWVSEVNEGYSIDNIAPPPPTSIEVNLDGNNNVLLTWDSPNINDLSYFAIYKGNNSGFDPSLTETYSEVYENQYIDDLANIGESYLIVSTFDLHGNESDYSNEVFVSPLSNNEGLPTQFTLHEVYPNPFNPVTTISFEIPHESMVSVKVYNINGKLIDTLVDKFYHIGKYSINWDGNSHPSGVYLIRMESGEFVQTQKVVLVK